MTWRVIYHPDVANDLLAIGQAEAHAILKVITKRIQNGEPDKLGKPLAGQLVGCRRIRTSSTRIVYRVNAQAIEILIVAVGQRRDAGNKVVALILYWKTLWRSVEKGGEKS